MRPSAFRLVTRLGLRARVGHGRQWQLKYQRATRIPRQKAVAVPIVSADPLSALANECVPETLAVRRDQASGGTGEMDWQDERAGVSHVP